MSPCICGRTHYGPCKDTKFPLSSRMAIGELIDGDRIPDYRSSAKASDFVDEVAKLETENAELRRKSASVKALIDLAHSLGWNGVENSKILEVFFADYIADLSARLQKAEADSRRMDWLDGNRWWDFTRAGNPSKPEATFHLDTDDSVYSESSTRQAIDAAIAASENKEVKE